MKIYNYRKSDLLDNYNHLKSYMREIITTSGSALVPSQGWFFNCETQVQYKT